MAEHRTIEDQKTKKDDQVALGSEASGNTTDERHGETTHQFWCPRHGDYVITDKRDCTVMVGRCPQCVVTDHQYNTSNIGGRLGPMAFSPAYRCNCRRANKRIATTGMWA